MPTVTVYTQLNCVQCRFTKRQLESEHISFREIDLNKHPEARERLREQGFQATPVVETSTDTWAGYQPAKIKALIA